MKFVSEEIQSLTLVNGNLNKKIEAVEKKNNEAERLLNQFRLDIISINTKRVQKKEQLEKEISEKDFERMELKVYIKTLRDLHSEVKDNELKSLNM